jgi:hypothetical protein
MTYPRDARDFLQIIFAGGRPVPLRLILERGAVHGFSYSQFRHAEQMIGIRSAKNPSQRRGIEAVDAAPGCLLSANEDGRERRRWQKMRIGIS